VNKTIYVSLFVVREEIRKILSPEFCNELLEKLSERGTSVPVNAVGDAEKLAEWFLEEHLSPMEEFLKEIRKFFGNEEETKAITADKEKMAALIKALKPLLEGADVSKDILEALDSLPSQTEWMAKVQGLIDALEELLPNLREAVEQVVADHQKWLKEEHRKGQAEAEVLATSIIDDILRILGNDGLLVSQTASMNDLPGDTRRKILRLL